MVKPHTCKNMNIKKGFKEPFPSPFISTFSPKLSYIISKLKMKLKTLSGANICGKSKKMIKKVKKN